MNSYYKEQNKSYKESDFKLFSLKGKNLYFNKELNRMNKGTKNNFTINNNKKINENKEEQKFHLTNIVLRERVKTSKPKIRINKEKIFNINEINKMDNNNEQFLDIQKILTINTKKFIKNVKINKYPLISMDNKKFLKKNLSSSNLSKRLYNVIEQNQKPKKVSKGQQTFQNNEIRILSYKNQRKTIIVRKSINNDNKLDESSQFKGNEIKSLEYNNNILSNNINNNRIFIKGRNPDRKNNEKNMENNEDEQITDYMNNINLNNINKIDYFNKRNFHNTINSGEIYKIPKPKDHLNKAKRIFKNHSNIMNFKYLHIEETKETKSIREIYRSLLLSKQYKAKKKNIKSLLKNKHIVECINKKEKSTRKIIKRPYHNLVSLENHTQDSKNNKSTKNVKLKNINEMSMIKDLKLLNKKKHYGTVYVNKPEDNENFFSNILKSFSRARERINKTKIKKSENKNYLINIQTMIELNNKSKKIF